LVVNIVVVSDVVILVLLVACAYRELESRVFGFALAGLLVRLVSDPAPTWCLATWR
jgi:hypothetical protein